MKVSKKELNLLLGFLGILAAFLVYQFVYTKMVEKTKILEAETAALNVEIARLEELETQKEFFETENDRMNVEISNYMNKFAVDVLPEDDIKFAYQQDNRGISDYLFIEAMSFTEPGILMSTNQFTLPEGVSNYLYNTFSLYSEQTSYTMKCSYSSLKDIVEEIYKIKNRRAIDSISMAFDEGTGLLQGNVVMNSYFVDGLDKAYVAPTLTPVRQGTDNIFGTVDVADVEPQEAP